jgi:preprotein translocase subunit SecF
VLRGFSIAMLWGIVIGTYSSLFIAAPLLYYIQPRGGGDARGEGLKDDGKADPAATKAPAIAARERTT